MKNYFFQIKNKLPFLLIFFIAACNGPTRTSETKEPIGPKNTIEQHPKIVRTKGTSSGVVRCELLDKDGNLWFSISGEGVYRFDGKLFTNFNTENGLCNDNVGAIIQDKAGHILFATNSGICMYDGKNFTKHPVPDTLNVSCIFEDKDGNLWFGTMGDGVYRYNAKGLDNFLNSKDPVFNLGNKNQLILDIIQDRNGNLWFSSWNGGGVWRFDGKDFKNFLPPAEYYETNQDKRNFNGSQHTFTQMTGNSYVPPQDYICDDMIFSMTEDKAGNIWFATRDHGVCRYDGKLFTSVGEKDGFPSRGAYAILEDRKGSLWFTTEKDGVWCYDGKTFKNFTEKDGLINNAVLYILEDTAGNLWFGTKWFGLSRYDGKSFTTFSQAEN